VNCNEATETCCGAHTRTPSCVAKTSDKKCCTWHESATTCAALQSCCGQLGTGATSVAFCCDEFTSCCTARVATNGSSACCNPGTKCCQGPNLGFCCPLDQECDLEFSRCVDPVTGAPTDAATGAPTDAATDAPTQAATDCPTDAYGSKVPSYGPAPTDANVNDGPAAGGDPTVGGLSAAGALPSIAVTLVAVVVAALLL
jgi:hypothetical protein